MHSSYLLEHPEAEYALDIDHDLLLEVISMSEAKEVKSYLSEIKTAGKVMREANHNRRQHIPMYFDKGKPAAPAAAEKQAAPAAGKGKAKAKAKAEAKAAAPAADKSKLPHWRPPVNAQAVDATSYIKKFACPKGDVVVDDYNGRWRCFYPGFKPKSVSWTKRGLHDAANVVLHQLWTWHEAATGLPAPFNVEELLS